MSKPLLRLVSLEDAPETERRSGSDEAAHARRLREEIRLCQMKFNKLRESYTLLLARKTTDDQHRQYEELQSLYERERTVWQDRRENLRKELEDRTEQCRRLEVQLQLQKDVADLKARLARLQMQ